MLDHMTTSLCEYCCSIRGQSCTWTFRGITCTNSSVCLQREAQWKYVLKGENKDVDLYFVFFFNHSEIEAQPESTSTFHYYFFYLIFFSSCQFSWKALFCLIWLCVWLLNRGCKYLHLLMWKSWFMCTCFMCVPVTLVGTGHSDINSCVPPCFVHSPSCFHSDPPQTLEKWFNCASFVVVTDGTVKSHSF